MIKHLRFLADMGAVELTEFIARAVHGRTTMGGHAQTTSRLLWAEREVETLESKMCRLIQV